MSTFIQKLRVVTLGTVHDLLDKAVDTNSPSALRQHVRDLEAALDRMRNDAAIQAGQLRTMEREDGDLQSRVATEKAVIQKLLAANDGVKEELARLKATHIVQLEGQLARLSAQIETQRANSQAIDQAVLKLESKHSEVLFRLRELERLDRDTKAREQAADSLRLAQAVLNTGNVDSSVDDIEGRMLARNDVAREKFDRAVTSMQNSVPAESSSSAAVDELLDSLRPKQLKAAS
jgi:phage shock protein A